MTSYKKDEQKPTTTNIYVICMTVSFTSMYFFSMHLASNETFTADIAHCVCKQICFLYKLLFMDQLVFYCFSWTSQLATRWWTSQLLHYICKYFTAFLDINLQVFYFFSWTSQLATRWWMQVDLFFLYKLLEINKLCLTPCCNWQQHVACCVLNTMLQLAATRRYVDAC